MSKFSEEQIRTFIADFWDDDLQRLNPDDLFGSLGIDGDDAFEFMEKYAETFRVNLDDYRWYFHGGEEGVNYGSLFSKAPYERVDRIPISIALLLNSANAGYWPADYPPHELPKRRYDILFNQVFFGVVVLAFVAWIIIRIS